MAKVTLQRVLAEIKNLETKLPTDIAATKFVGAKVGQCADLRLDQMAQDKINQLRDERS